MEPKLQLIVFVLLIQGSFAVQQRATVKKGQTVFLRCPRRNPQHTIEWKNPEGYVMYIKHEGVDRVDQGVKDKRYSIIKQTEFEFTISVSGVTFKDGGTYTCNEYDNSVINHRVEVTVLGLPKIRKTKHEGRFDIKCSAEGNGYPPQIFWKLDHGPEILAQYQVTHEDKEFVSNAMIRIQSVKSKITVTCLVRHPALHSETLVDFVTIGKNTRTTTTTTPSPTTPPPGSTKVTTTGWFKQESTTVFLSVPTSQPFYSDEPQNVTSTSSHLSTRGNSSTSVLPGSTSGSNDTASNATSTTDWTFVTETTEITSYNSTEGNATGNFNDTNKRIKKEGSSSLLIVLVSFLIFCLLVVVTFFAIKLRRAHLAWKRENEDSNPSEESSKSKSSQEEKNSQGQRRRGIFNTAFTQYVAEESPAITSVINTAAMATAETVNEVQTSQPDTAAKSGVKETEL